jgi:poly-beta-1,6-N-acetyl-D-glucosamine synthase
MVSTQSLLRPLGVMSGLGLLGAAVYLAWSGSIEQIDALDDSAFAYTGLWAAPLGLAMMTISNARFVTMVWLSFLDQWRSQEHPGMAARNLPFVSIVVPVFNEGSMIRASLGSLLRLNYPKYEIIVVDDGSSDATFDRAYWLRKSTGAHRVRILTKQNGGKAHALNHGIANSSGSLVLCVDGDTILESDALLHAVRRFDDPQIGAVAGCVRVINRAGIWARFQALEYACGLALPKRAQSAAHAVAIVPGPIGLFRREALSEVGGYDCSIFSEDFDLTLKILGAGWHVVYEPKALAFTEAPEHGLDLIQQRYRWNRGMLHALLRRRHLSAEPVAAPLTCLAMWYLFADSLVWPLLNVVGLVMMIVALANPGMQSFVVLWWLQLVLLNAAIASYCIVVEHEQLGLLLVAPASSVLYTYFLDVWRLLAAFDELLGVRMGWGSVRRLGRLQ